MDMGSVANPLCILLKGKANGSYCKRSALQLAVLPCWPARARRAALGMG